MVTLYLKPHEYIFYRCDGAIYKYGMLINEEVDNIENGYILHDTRTTVKFQCAVLNRLSKITKYDYLWDSYIKYIRDNDGKCYPIHCFKQLGKTSKEIKENMRIYKNSDEYLWLPKIDIEYLSGIPSKKVDGFYGIVVSTADDV